MSRPTKLTKEVSAAICESVKIGATYEDAAGAAGIAYSTYNEWVQRGKAEKRGVYAEFVEALDIANAECGRNMAHVIQQAAAKGDWKAAESWLRRRRRADWGDNVDVTSGGEKVKAYIGWTPDLWDNEK